jgi:hypothetical protein
MTRSQRSNKQRLKNHLGKEDADLDASRAAKLETLDGEVEEQKDISSTKKPESSTLQPSDNSYKVLASLQKVPPPLQKVTMAEGELPPLETGVETEAETEAGTGAGAADNTRFKVQTGYDDGFLKFSRITTISELLAAREKELNDSLLPDVTASYCPTFLRGVLLKIAPPKETEQNHYTPFKQNTGGKFVKRAKPNPSGYKRNLVFGDLEDKKCFTFAIMEPNNEKHNQLFPNKTMENVVVGSQFAIKSPYLCGVLKSGSHVITTDRPLEVLVEPPLPIRPLKTDNVVDSMRYFVMEGKVMRLGRENVVTPIQTLCNGRACDRLQSYNCPTAKCGCWGQVARGDTLAKNVVLVQDFCFNDGSDKIVSVNNFTSLKFSKQLFAKSQMLTVKDDLQKDAVFYELQKAYRNVVKYVNVNGGWTIVGWYKRSRVTEDDKQDNDTELFATSVKINVSHLVPSTKKGSEIPEDIRLTQTTIMGLLD